jgi:hypothetical protein
MLSLTSSLTLQKENVCAAAADTTKKRKKPSQGFDMDVQAEYH